MEQQDSYIRTLFIDYSSACNTILPNKLAIKLNNLDSWSQDNNLALNSRKTKELIFDFRTLTHYGHHPISINGERVEAVQSFRFLGLHISQDLALSINTTMMAKKGLQMLHFPRSLKKAQLLQ